MAFETFAVRILGAGLAYVSQILLARWMGPHEYGLYSIVWTWVIVLGLFACLGFSSSTPRFLPQYWQTNDFGLIRGFMYASRLSAFIAGCIIAAIGSAIVLSCNDLIEPYYTGPFLAAFCALPFFAFATVQDGIARSHDWSSLAMLPTYIWRPLLILIGILVFLLQGVQVTATMAAIVAVIATACVALYQYVALSRRLRTNLDSGPREIRWKYWVLISLPMLLVEGFLQLLTSADVIMVSFWHPPEEVAIYFAASKTLAIAHFVYFAVRAAAAHRFATFIQSDDHDGLQAFARQATLWTFGGTLCVGVVLALAAPLFLALFGEGFSSGRPILIVLLLGILIRASIGPLDALLNMSGLEKTCAAIYAATFAVNVALNFVLVVSFGLIGAAWATTLAICFEVAALSFAAHSRLGIQTFFLFHNPFRRASKD
ncbi:MAG: lipopolysaccharide biosynthesis protein [Rhodobacteraceae bacterium]|nr:lipopolysaccharide biosynthesis protein [Paracoccaceae bacterium]